MDDLIQKLETKIGDLIEKIDPETDTGMVIDLSRAVEHLANAHATLHTTNRSLSSL